jgi:glycosyltransferase involved in cell wall biosynthesis
LSDADATRFAPRGPRPTGDKNILFALYGDFSANSALHVAALANELIGSGYDCVVAVPNHKETLGALPEARFMALHFDEIGHLPAYFKDGRGPRLIHAWTTRENVRKFCSDVVVAYGSAVFVHLEDNEQEILETRLGIPYERLAALSEEELDRLVPDMLSHPRRAERFLSAATGITVIVERLKEQLPASVPHSVISPAADAKYFRPRPRDEKLRAALGILPSDVVLFYHGNVHTSNAVEVRSLYEAVVLLNERGQRTQLVRTGRDYPGFLSEGDAWIRPYLIHLGHIGRAKHLPALMALADYFVQPGLPDAFNNYRFPSKLPEFFALGRPVILPRSNLGDLVRDGEHARVLPRADAPAIADAIAALHADPALAEKLSRGALAFAAEHFSWPRSARLLAQFYRSLTPLAAAASS